MLKNKKTVNESEDLDGQNEELHAKQTRCHNYAVSSSVF